MRQQLLQIVKKSSPKALEMRGGASADGGLAGSIPRPLFNDRFGWATQRQGAEFSVTIDGGRHWRWLNGPPRYGSWGTNAVFLTTQYGYATLESLYMRRKMVDEGGNRAVETVK